VAATPPALDAAIFSGRRVFMHVEVSFPDAARIQSRCKGLVVETGLPPDRGGDPEALGPFDVLLCSLANCTGFHVLTFLQERGIPTADAGVTIEGTRSAETHLLDKVSLAIHVPPEFPDKYRDGIMRAAGQCLVKAQLGQHPEFDVSVTRNASG
jgi:ribosomal protein S12 methylthiotransferase accessory factor